MKFFLDENFPKLGQTLLKDRGHEVFDIRGTSQEGADDVTLFEISKKHKAIFLTTDKDFYHTIHLKCKPHYGIVVVALSQPNAKSILEKLDWFLNNYDKTVHDNICYLILNNKCKIFR